MKKIFLLTAIAVYAITFAQCKIIGNAQTQNNRTETYAIENDNAQCTDCHLWSVTGGNAYIDGEFRKNSVKLVSKSGGAAILSLTMLTAQGVVLCSKSIDIIDSNMGNNANNVGAYQGNLSKNCDIDVTNFKEIKFGEGMYSFFPNQQNQLALKYTWTVTYLNRETKESAEKVPVFPNTETNPIIEVKVKIMSDSCLRSFSKTYEANFWKVLK